MSRVITLARELLCRASVTPSDGGTIDWLSRQLAPFGFAASVETTPNGTTNAWITHGQGAPLFVFAGHVDVVPPGAVQDWTSPPFAACVRDGRLYGRGAADMKGSVAAAADAFMDFAERHPDHPGTLALLLTSDEEGDGDEGTRRVVEQLRSRGTVIDWCIVGEPSCSRRFGDTVKNGRRGSLNGRLTVRGRLGHVAYPQLADNPIHPLVALLHTLTQYPWDRGDAFFDPTSFQLSNIEAGVGAVNVIPASATALFNVRFGPQWTAERLQQTIEQLIAQHTSQAEITWKCSAHPFITAPGRLCECLSQAVDSRCGIRPCLSTSGGTSDARFISQIARETVEFGPLNATIHSIDECVGIDELESLSAVYLQTIESLFFS